MATQYEISVDHENEFITLVVRGSVTNQHAFEIVRKLVKHPEFNPNYATLVDWREADFSDITIWRDTAKAGDFELSVSNVAERLKKADPRRGPIAILTSGESTHMDIAKLYGAGREIAGLSPMQAFDNLHKAKGWLHTELAKI